MEPQDYDDDDLSKTRKELFPASNFFPREVTGEEGSIGGVH